jgi:hypothetical protein
LRKQSHIAQAWKPYQLRKSGCEVLGLIPFDRVHGRALAFEVGMTVLTTLLTLCNEPEKLVPKELNHRLGEPFPKCLGPEHFTLGRVLLWEYCWISD